MFRWSAVLAGVACSVGLWSLLQVLGTGIGLSAIDVDDAGSLRGVGIGTTIWSLIAPLIAMFCGGLLAGRLSQAYERKLGGAHGLVMWSITSVLGLMVVLSMVTALASAVTQAGGAAMHAAGGAMTRDDAANIAGQIDERRDELDQRARELGPRAEHAALTAADAAGKALTTIGLALLLGLGAAGGGAMLAVRRLRRPGDDGDLRATAPYRAEPAGATLEGVPPASVAPLDRSLS